MGKDIAHANKPSALESTRLFDSTIRKGDLNKINRLLLKGADINSRDREGKTALWWAAFNGNVDLVKYLLNKDANSLIADYKHKMIPFKIARSRASELFGHQSCDVARQNYFDIMRMLHPLIPGPKVSSTADSHERFLAHYHAQASINTLLRMEEAEVSNPPNQASSGSWLSFFKTSQPLNAQNARTMYARQGSAEEADEVSCCPCCTIM